VPPIRVVIADDHRIFREGLRPLLVDAGIDVIGEAEDGSALLGMLAADPPDVVVLDLSMPGIPGLEALAHVRQIAPTTRVLVLTMHDEPGYVRRAIELGAAGYVLKSAGRAELLRALTHVAQGDAYLQGEITGPLLRRLSGDEPARSLALSPREREVLQLAANGLENKQIAARLELSEATVKGYLRTAFERLGARSRAEAVAIGLRLGLLE